VINPGEKILSERVLLYLRDQHERFGIAPVPSNPDFMSPSMLAYLKHDLNDLMIEGKVDRSIFDYNFLNCNDVADKLPKVLDHLVSAGSMEKTSAGYVLKPWSNL